MNVFSDRPLGNLIWTLVFIVLIAVPCLHLLPASSPWHLSDYWIILLGRILCFAMVALALDLVWGYAGILSLGHGLYFALGGYMMGMYLTRAAAGEGTPAFVAMSGLNELPWFFAGTQHFSYALLLVFLVPGVVAFLFGFFAFRSKIKGVYFSIISQAMTYAAYLLFYRNATGFGGNNGFTDFKTILGADISAPSTRVWLACLSAITLMIVFIGLRTLMRRPFGQVLQAVRDGESRLQFLGYNPLWYKLSAWVLSAAIAAIAGALYVPQTGIINPSEMATINSIEMVVWVAAGGRGTLAGALIGAGGINALKNYFTVAYPEFWLLILGSLFIAVTLFLPRGVIGLFSRLTRKEGTDEPS